MKTKKLTDKEMGPYKIASLPSRPTAPTSFGGKGYTSKEMKEAFDRLPLFIAERLNSLIDDVGDYVNGIAASMPTAIGEGHTLKNMFADIILGGFAGYLAVPGGHLADVLTEMRADIDSLKEKIGE